MQTRLTVLAAFLWLPLLCACTTFQQNNSQVSLPGGGVFTLLPAKTLNRSLVVTQRVQGQFKDKKFVLLAQLEVNRDQLAMVGATLSGSTLFSLTHQNNTINVERAPWLPEQLKPEYMLADIQIIYWPLVSLTEQLNKAGITIEEKIDTKGGRRTLTRMGKPIIDIYYDNNDAWSGRVRFENHQWLYRYTIDTVQVDTL